MYETWYKMTAMIQSGLDISPVITHRFPYTQFKQAIELMKSGNSGKIVLNWSNLSSRAFRLLSGQPQRSGISQNNR